MTRSFISAVFIFGALIGSANACDIDSAQSELSDAVDYAHKAKRAADDSRSASSLSEAQSYADDAARLARKAEDAAESAQTAISDCERS